ncbi:MAG: thiamine diphosphokinase [Oscillospiraceae bacterium]|nr:thiamine diphosphokinase [Oscillospiraceae bacterium]
MRCVIFSGGRIDGIRQIKDLLHPDDFIIAADGGYLHAQKLGHRVDLLVGDFDSLETVPDGVPVLKYPVKKEVTDTEIALFAARERGCDRFLFLGCTGSRLDHTLANIFLLKNCRDHGEDAVIIDSHNEIRLLNRKMQLRKPKGSIVSLIPVTGCVGVTTTGLAYPLNGETLFWGSARGVSNVMVGDTATVRAESGELLVIAARD